MEGTGVVHGITKDWETDKFLVTFKVNESMTPEEIESLCKCKKLSIIAKQYREKRSLDANAYFHVLCGKLADKLRISKPRCKNILLYRYGQSEMLDESTEAILHSNVPSEKMLEQEQLHCFPIGTDEEGMTIYRIQRPSHTLNSYEFSILIDGVIDECKDWGIETMTPEQLARMMDLWEKNHG